MLSSNQSMLVTSKVACASGPAVSSATTTERLCSAKEKTPKARVPASRVTETLEATPTLAPPVGFNSSTSNVRSPSVLSADLSTVTLMRAYRRPSANVSRPASACSIHTVTHVWYGILGFNVPLDTVYRSFRIRGALSSDVHLPFSNEGQET